MLLSSYSKTVVSYNPDSVIQCDVFSHDILLIDQGQIKTGAPCRSERLAKYNQVSILRLHYHWFLPMSIIFHIFCRT